MKTIKFTKGTEAEGRAEGDVVSVDERSAAAFIERGDAVPYDDVPELDSVPTIDDIVDPGVARNRRHITAIVVGGPGVGAPTPAKKAAPAAVSPRPKLAAPAAHAVVGDAGGGPGS